MLKKILYVCNRCGEEIMAEGTRIIPYFFDLATGEALCEIKIPDNDTHFCVDCAMKIMEEILALPGEGAEKGSEEAPDKKTEKQRVWKKKPLDAGKVMALHQAGWSEGQIADEMGFTERQVRQCIRYRTKKAGSGSGTEGKEQKNEA